MNAPKIDETKLIEVKELIDKAAELLENPEENAAELENLESRLRELSGKPELDVNICEDYSGWTSLQDLAETILMPTPVKQGLTDGEIAEIVTNAANVKYSEAETDYYLNLLELETGLDDLTDYIYYPDLKGLDKNAELPEIIAKILEDRH